MNSANITTQREAEGWGVPHKVSEWDVDSDPQPSRGSASPPAVCLLAVLTACRTLAMALDHSVLLYQGTVPLICRSLGAPK